MTLLWPYFDMYHCVLMRSKPRWSPVPWSFAAREAAIWELEERQLHEKHQLIKRQLKDVFFLKRHHMLTRHEKVSDLKLRAKDHSLLRTC